MKEPFGRPTKYSSEYCEKVIALMDEGASIAEVARELRVTKQTLHNWMSDHKDFFDAFELARGFSEGWWCKTGRLNLENKNFQSKLYDINMQNRFGWSRKNDVNTTIELGDTARENLQKYSE